METVSEMIHLDNHSHRFWALLVLQILALIIALFMALGGSRVWGQRSMRDGDGDSRLAVLENRADQIDQHLQNTDANVKAISLELSVLQQEVSVMQGEEYAAWAFISLLCAGSIGVTVVGRKRGA